MFDTMTLTKAAGAFIGALLFMMLAGWAAEGLYHVGAPAGHGGEHAEGEEGEEAVLTQAYSIPVPESAAGGEEEAPLDFAALMEAADPAAGEGEWAKCRACHALDGSDGVGPHLNGVVGRDVASIAGFGYSGAMSDHAAEAPVWDVDHLQAFLENPRGVVSGTAMSFAGLKNPEARANLIAYLQTTQP